MSLDVAGDPSAGALGLRLGREFCHVGEAGLSKVGPVDGVRCALGRPSCVEVSHLVALRP